MLFRSVAIDDNGNTGEGNLNDSDTVAITVRLVDTPSVLVPDTATIAEDTVLNGNVLANDTDVDSQLAVVSFTIDGVVYSVDDTATIDGVGTFGIGVDGSYWFVPNPNWFGSVPTVTYTTNTRSSSTLDITVTPVDDPSSLGPDTAETDEDTPSTGNVLGNDNDVDNVLAVASFAVGGSSYLAGATATISGIGTIEIDADGTFTFTPAANWNGTVPTITYTTNTGSSSTLDITVNPVDDPSVLTPDIATIAEDGVATGNVLGNDRDVDSPLVVDGFEVNGFTYAAGDTATID